MIHFNELAHNAAANSIIMVSAMPAINERPLHTAMCPFDTPTGEPRRPRRPTVAEMQEFQKHHGN
jgi:hypothetical protein